MEAANFQDKANRHRLQSCAVGKLKLKTSAAENFVQGCALRVLNRECRRLREKPQKCALNTQSIPARSMWLELRLKILRRSYAKPDICQAARGPYLLERLILLSRNGKRRPERAPQLQDSRGRCQF